MKLEYRGPQQDGIDIPDAGITAWKPGEVREIPDQIAGELVEFRSAEFRHAPDRKKADAP